AYAAFQRFGDDGRSQRVDYLRFLAKLSNLLDENEGTIKHATDFAVYASEEKDKSLAYGLLAQAYSNKNQFDKASRYFQAALKIQLTTLGPEHPDLAVTYSNIGMACDFQGEHDKAIGYHQKSLAVRRDPNHLVVAPTYNKIGRNYADCGETAKAIAYLQRAEAIYLKQLGVDHPLTKSAQISLDRLND
ncbi:MAG: tetratricopeptide repeat protein, partial [Opitutales bacterium]